LSDSSKLCLLHILIQRVGTILILNILEFITVGVGISQSLLFACACRPALRPIQASLRWVPGVLSLGVKWPEHEADHSAPCSDEVKNARSYTSILPCVLMACRVLLFNLALIVEPRVAHHHTRFTYSLTHSLTHSLHGAGYYLKS
jgi:hypothetical protein